MIFMYYVAVVVVSIGGIILCNEVYKIGKILSNAFDPVKQKCQ